MAGVLYIVATPIGNMGDITYRAVETLKSCDFIAAEDTRVSGKLLMLLDIKKPFLSYHEHNKKKMGEIIADRIKGGESCALVTDAGTPAISDPGADIVSLCRERGIKIVPIPGVSAVVTAISVCGLQDGRFAFEGFLDDNRSKRRERLERLSKLDVNTVLYSAPHDVETVLTDMLESFKGRTVYICRELTKINETVVKCVIEDAVKMLASGEIVKKGEFVIVAEGYKEKDEDRFWFGMTVSQHVDHYIKNGFEKMEAIKKTAKDRKVSKSVIYDTVCGNGNEN